MKKVKTFFQKKENVKRNWHLVDLKGEILGRMATKIAFLLMGKGKVVYSPSVDVGDCVVAINASEVKVTGKKEKKKIYYRHSGYPGGFRELTYEQLKAKDPRKVIKEAILGMLPKNKLRSKRLARLKIFVDGRHPYEKILKSQISKLMMKK